MELNASTYLAERSHEVGLPRLRTLRHVLKGLDDAAGGRALTPESVAAWAATLDHLRPTTRRTTIAAARQYGRWLADTGRVSPNPCSALRLPRVPRAVPRALPSVVVGAMVTAAPDARARLLVVLMVQLGLRRAETVALDWSDIDWHAGTVLVTGKGGHQRVLPLLAPVAQAVEAYVRDERGRGSGPLILGAHGGRLSSSSVGRIVAELVEQIGAKRGPFDGVSAHALRHTMATDSLRHGAHLRDVQAALGHAQITTTERYLPLYVDGLAHAMGGRRY